MPEQSAAGPVTHPTDGTIIMMFFKRNEEKRSPRDLLKEEAIRKLRFFSLYVLGLRLLPELLRPLGLLGWAGHQKKFGALLAS